MDPSPEQPQGMLVQAWLVILLALIYGGALAGVQVGLGDRIRANKQNETYDQIPSLVAGAVKDQTKEHEVVGANGRPTVVYEARDAKGQRVGWVLPGSGQGFADRIELLIGLDADLTTIRGLFVIDQKETPGLGNYITDAQRFRNQFAGKQVAPPLTVVKSNPDPKHEIQALTGATISSESVSSIVNQTIANLKQAVLDKSKQQ
jgi:Na+-translocating ferredoxin:NAD+ oxidoreductase subunit G